MIKNKEIGWMGMLKAALTITCIIIFGITSNQCNSTLEQQDFTENVAITNEELMLAKWENTYSNGEINKSEVISLTISKDMITLQGEEQSLDELVKILNEFSSQWRNKQVLATIDANTSMCLVDNVFHEFRRFNVRKFLFEGLSIDGKEVSYLKMVLPPRKNFEVEDPWQNDVNAIGDEEEYVGVSENSYLMVTPLLSKEWIIKNNWPMLSLVSSDQKDWKPNHRIDIWPPLQDVINDVPDLDKKYPDTPVSGEIDVDIKDFVNYHSNLGSAYFITMVYYSDHTLFQEFVTTNNQIRGAVLELYDSRSQEQFAKSYIELSKEQSLKIKEGLSLAIILNGGEGGRWTYDYSPS